MYICICIYIYINVYIYIYVYIYVCIYICGRAGGADVSKHDATRAIHVMLHVLPPIFDTMMLIFTNHDFTHLFPRLACRILYRRSATL